ncbi:MAG: hypothetical protein D6819_05615, partial [Gammaproteobacteria bacterium]
RTPPPKPAAQRAAPSKPPLLPFDETIRQARLFYKKKRYREAAALYRKLIRQYPRRYEPYGELGNIYYKLRRYEEAAKLYYEAAVRLQAAGLAAKAWRLQKAMERFAPRYARRLKQKLSSSLKKGRT